MLSVNRLVAFNFHFQVQMQENMLLIEIKLAGWFMDYQCLLLPVNVKASSLQLAEKKKNVV